MTLDMGLRPENPISSQAPARRRRDEVVAAV